LIDFVKIQVLWPPIKRLLEHSKLDFRVELNEETSEVHSQYKTAKFQHLKFQIINGKYLNISGSLHKFWHNGINHDDYQYLELKDTIKFLETNFGIDPKNCIIRNLEFGINIETINDPDYYLSRMIDFKGKALSEMTGKRKSIGIKCQMAQYIIKIYNKSYQCNLTKNTMRIEIKVIRMKFIEKAGIRTLKDLFHQKKLALLGILLNDLFNSVLMYDPDLELSNSDRYLYLAGQSPLFWERMKHEKHPSYTYIRRKFKEICNTNGNTYQNELLEQIQQKWEQLLNL